MQGVLARAGRRGGGLQCSPYPLAGFKAVQRAREGQGREDREGTKGERKGSSPYNQLLNPARTVQCEACTVGPNYEDKRLETNFTAKNIKTLSLDTKY